MNLRLPTNRRCLSHFVILAITVAAAQQCWSDDTLDFGAPCFHGFSQPWELIQVAVSEPGRVDQVNVREGDRVRRDALIARLDDSVLKASLNVAIQKASAGGEAEQARARLNHAARRRDDIAALLQESHASQSELDQADLSLREAEAAMIAAQERRDIAKAEVAKIRAELERREIRSPIDGVVIGLNRRQGEYAGGSDPVIAQVAVLEKLRLRINVPTRIAIERVVGERVEIEFPEIDVRVMGIIDLVSPVTDSQSGTVRIDIQLDNPAGRLRSGLLGVWRCPLPQADGLIPESRDDAPVKGLTRAIR